MIRAYSTGLDALSDGVRSHYGVLKSRWLPVVFAGKFAATVVVLGMVL
jgi:hypothetical protein